MTELLDLAIDAAGGRQRWRAVDGISAHVRSSGLLMRMKGKADLFRDYGLSVTTERQMAVIQPYPREGSSGVFDARRNLRWDDLDALYFAGYALWNYMAIPLLFERPGFEVSEGASLVIDGDSFRRLDVLFPEDIHTHCRRQALYFDALGLLRRHDYHPDVVSSLAKAAHLCDGHREVRGLVFATKRRVVPKSMCSRPLRGPTVVSLDFDSIEVD
jgi:hypothetical protein